MSRFSWTIVLLLLVLANALLFGVQKGWLGQVWTEGREPERMKKELAVDRFKLIAPLNKPDSQPEKTIAQATPSTSETPVIAETNAASNESIEKPNHSTDSKAAEAVTPAVAAVTVPASIIPTMPPTNTSPATIASTPTAAPNTTAARCLQTTTLTIEDSNAFKTAIKSLNLKSESHDASEASSWMVHIPSQRSQEEVDARVEELKKAGVKDYFVIQDNGPMRMAISLGVFKVEESARSFQQGLVKQGVTQATLTPRLVNKVQLKFSEVNEADAAKLREAFKTAVHSAGPGKPNPELKDCGNTTASKP